MATPLRSGYRFGSADLPQEFAHPPLIEAWLGVEFGAPIDFTKIDASVWRQRLGPEWPASWQLIGAAERHAPGVTLIENQLRNVMNDRAIRFGTQGFSFGWLGHDGSIYPRYEAIRDGFVATLDAVRDVMPQIGSPVRSSVTYLNRIPQGTVWTTPGDWSFFRLWQPNPLARMKIGPESFAGSWKFPLDGDRGHLTVEFTHEPATEKSQDAETVWLRMTSSGPTDPDESSLFDGLDYSREMIVRAFSELVTSDAKQFWGVVPRKRSGQLA
jgi:uncharacterized protein (TIGR04255 family)